MLVAAEMLGEEWAAFRRKRRHAKIRVFWNDIDISFA